MDNFDQSNRSKTKEASLMDADLQKSLHQIRGEIKAGKYSGRRKRRPNVISHLQPARGRGSTKREAKDNNRVNRDKDEGGNNHFKASTRHVGKSEWFSKYHQDAIQAVHTKLYPSFTELNRALKNDWPQVTVRQKRGLKEEDGMKLKGRPHKEVVWGPVKAPKENQRDTWYTKYTLKTPTPPTRHSQPHHFKFSPPSFNSFSELCQYLKWQHCRVTENQAQENIVPAAASIPTGAVQATKDSLPQHNAETIELPSSISTHLASELFPNNKRQTMDPPYQPLPVVNVHPDEVLENAALWQFALVGFLFGALPAFSLLRGGLPLMWNVQCSIHAMRRNVFMINFISAADRNRVESEGPWVFHGALIFLTRWSRELNVDYISITRIPSWIRIEGAPVEYWNQRTLHRMASVVGEVILISPRTTSFYNTDFIEACVYINLLEPLLQHFHMNCNGRVRLLTILYQGNHHVCIECGGLEHSFLNCNGQPLWYITDEETDTDMEEEPQENEINDNIPEAEMVNNEEDQDASKNTAETVMTMNRREDGAEGAPMCIPGVGEINPPTIYEVPVRQIEGRPLNGHEIMRNEAQNEDSRMGTLHDKEADDLLRCEEMLEFEEWARELENVADLAPINTRSRTTSGNIFRAPSPPESPASSRAGSPRSSTGSASFRMQAPSPCTSEPSSPSFKSMLNNNNDDVADTADSTMRQTTAKMIAHEVNINYNGNNGLADLGTQLGPNENALTDLIPYQPPLPLII